MGWGEEGGGGGGWVARLHLSSSLFAERKLIVWGHCFGRRAIDNLLSSSGSYGLMLKLRVPGKSRFVDDLTLGDDDDC